MSNKKEEEEEEKTTFRPLFPLFSDTLAPRFIMAAAPVSVLVMRGA
jgi:hypothetical protein